MHSFSSVNKYGPRPGVRCTSSLIFMRGSCQDTLKFHNGGICVYSVRFRFYILGVVIPTIFAVSMFAFGVISIEVWDTKVGLTLIQTKERN